MGIYDGPLMRSLMQRIAADADALTSQGFSIVLYSLAVMRAWPQGANLVPVMAALLPDLVRRLSTSYQSLTVQVRPKKVHIFWATSPLFVCSNPHLAVSSLDHVVIAGVNTARPPPRALRCPLNTRGVLRQFGKSSISLPRPPTRLEPHCRGSQTPRGQSPASPRPCCPPMALQYPRPPSPAPTAMPSSRF
jgi:hypothetical protein